MIRLLRAELLRARSRRATWLLGFLGLILFLSILGGLFFGHRKEPTASERAQAEALRRGQIQYCADHPIDCEDAPEPTVELFLPDKRFHLASDGADVLYGFSVGLVVLSFVLGATLVGSEWHNGLIGNLLLWEPRRPRVLVAKALAAGVIAAVAVWVASLAMIAGLYWVTALRGTSAGLGQGFLASLISIGGRASLLAALVCVLGAGLASLTRSTAASVGLVLIYVGVLERFLGVLRPGWRPWMLGDLGAAVLVRHWIVYVPVEPTAQEIAFGSQTLKPVELTWQRGALVLGLYLAILLAVAIADFRRRDVT
ncbi:MAG: ABC transporter permease subunit [Actinobacteria bacterium]|nr:ABC transporter permease subunit [Actinomycetota bacterium]